jgi:hypothetical protein
VLEPLASVTEFAVSVIDEPGVAGLGLIDSDAIVGAGFPPPGGTYGSKPFRFTPG